GDAAGKKTQAELARDSIRRFREVTLLDFPRYEISLAGKLVKQALAGEYGDFRHLDPHLASLPYTVDRIGARETINAALSKSVVLCNRYVPSNAMYQAAKYTDARQQEEFIAWLEALEYEELMLPRPNLVVYLHVPFEVSQKLMDGRKKDVHEEDAEYLRTVVDLYLRTASKRPNWTVIECIRNGELMSREEIHAIVTSRIGKYL
ncbi:MAG TPA: hypothetical protein VD928_02105, partial [Candidatus Paceibacterota bacterium]|nr:hypothetical protein [Candidatus Paceibacterota bacterium]